MAEYIFEITGALYNEETGEAVMKPEFKGKLVRCKDCKHWERDVIFKDGWCRGERQYEDDFCSRGERRGEDGSN